MGLTFKTSASAHSQHLFRAGQTSPGSCAQLQILVINSSSVPGRQLGNSRTSASPGPLAAILMGLDSVELIMEVEKHFSISIPDPEAERAFTVGKLVDCVSKIIGVKRYDFSLRESTFDIIKNALLDLDSNVSDFPINSLVSKSINIKDKPLLVQLEGNTRLKFPGINTNTNEANAVFAKLKRWFQFSERIEFENITWKKYIDITLAVNLEKLSPAIQYNSKYEIYIAIMRITVDKIGVDYQEIGIEKSFTDDLGVD